MMNQLKLAGATAIVSLLAALGTYALTATFDPSSSCCPRLLLIGNGTDEHWQRTMAGAQAAAAGLGVELEVRPTEHRNASRPNASMLEQIQFVDYAGVVMSPADPVLQLNVINRMASQTKLVTLDQDSNESRRLCHVGFSQTGAGSLVAHLVRDQLKRLGKVAIVATTFVDSAENVNVTERLAGFNQAWASFDDQLCPTVAVEAMAGPATPEQRRKNVAAVIADPDVAFIVALDVHAAESALSALAAGSPGRRIPIIAFDPNEAIFNAIEDGRVLSAIYDDPYRAGFAAIQRLGEYKDATSNSLPAPGYGRYLLMCEVVSKNNLAEFRRRAGS